MFDITNLKVEKENPMEILSCLIFEMQKDYPNDTNYTEYTFRYLDDNELTKEDLSILQRKFNPHKIHVYVSTDTRIDDLMLIGFVYRKDSLPEFTKYFDLPKYEFEEKEKLR